MIAFGPDFSSHVWSTIWLAIAWPSVRLIFGVSRWTIAGKYPSILEKLWVGNQGVVLNCLLVREASSSAVRSPRIVTIRADNLSRGGIVITGVFSGRKLEVRRRPARMLPQARRLIGLITIGLFSLMGDCGRNRG